MTFASKKDYQKYMQSIKNITSYIDYFSKDDEVFGEWKTSSSLPSIHYAKKVDEFVKALYENGFLAEFDWTEWDYAQKIFQDHSLIKSLELMELEFLLTTIVRKEKFCEGVLMNAIDNGMILKILERLHFLHNPEDDLLYDEIIREKENDLIELNEFYVIGLEYYGGKEFDFAGIEFVSLQLEPENEYDSNAIEIYSNDTKVGYVPKSENPLIAKMMRQSVKIVAKVAEYNPESKLDKRIKIQLYQDGKYQVSSENSLEEEHIKVFGVKPYIIGIYWHDTEAIMDGILEAIRIGKPYNEYLMLSEDDRKAFDDGSLLF